MGRGSLRNWGAFFLQTGFSVVFEKPSPDIRGGEAVARRAMTVREPRLAGTNWKRFAPKKNPV
jgi:hypothetical protein